MNKFLLSLALVVSTSAFASPNVDSRIVGNWATPCAASGGVFMRNVSTFTAEGVMNSVDSAYSTSDCSGTPAESQPQPSMNYSTSDGAGGALVMKLTAIGAPTEGMPISMTMNVSFESPSRIFAKLVAATLHMGGQAVEIPASELEAMPAAELNRF